MPAMKNKKNIGKEDILIFAEETIEKKEGNMEKWKIMIVDDDEAVHNTTQRVLEDFVFEERSLEYIHAYSGKECISFMENIQDISLILLDVVMETDSAGLDAVHYIRKQLKNRFVRIILLTGQPGQAPERKVITEYDINDYRLKSMLTDQELYTAIMSALRNYRDLKIIDKERIALKEAMEDAQIAHKARYQFLANMGHEIRTPLNGILGLTESLLSSTLDERHKQIIEGIRKSGKGLYEVLKNVLDLTEIIEGKLVLNESFFSLRKTIRKVMDAMKIQASWKNLETSYKIDTDVPDNLIGDWKRLKQVLINLIVNAIKHTKEGHISLKVSLYEKDPLNLLFAVRDSGVGISSDKQDIIFQPFEVGENLLTKQFAGAGLGLTISQDIVEKMNGKIWLESEPEKGSIFYFTAQFKKSE